MPPAQTRGHFPYMTKICSWCQAEMVVPIRRAPEPMSEPLPTYGMCGSCLDAELEAIAPRPRTARARRAS